MFVDQTSVTTGETNEFNAGNYIVNETPDSGYSPSFSGDCDENGEVTDDANPNGARSNIAGVCNQNRNVLGMMPHPERACEELLGSNDGRDIFKSLTRAVALSVN